MIPVNRPTYSPKTAAMGKKVSLKYVPSFRPKKLKLCINISSVPDLKNAVDEFLPSLFEQLGYDQSFTLIDLRLGLGLLTVAIAAFLYYLEKNLTFQESYYIIMALIALYGLISAVMYYFSSTKKYQNLIYTGKDKKQTIWVYTLLVPFEPVYKVRVVVDDNHSGAIEEDLLFTKMFDSFGYMNETEVKQLFVQLLEKKKQ